MKEGRKKLKEGIFQTQGQRFNDCPSPLGTSPFRDAPGNKPIPTSRRKGTAWGNASLLGLNIFDTYTACEEKTHMYVASRCPSVIYSDSDERRHVHIYLQRCMQGRLHSLARCGSQYRIRKINSKFLMFYLYIPSEEKKLKLWINRKWKPRGDWRSSSSFRISHGQENDIKKTKKKKYPKH